MVSKMINKMKFGKAAGPSGIITEMIKVANNGIINCIMSLFNRIMHEGSTKWMTSIIYHQSLQRKMRCFILHESQRP